MTRSSAHAACIAACARALLLAGEAVAQVPQSPQPPPSPTLRKINETGVVTIGHRSEGVPFSYVTKDGRVLGYAIDLCTAIAEGIGRELKLKKPPRVTYVPVTGGNRIEMVQSGKADMECGHSVASPERRKDIAFSMPIFFSGPRILVRAGSPVKDFFDLNGRKVVIVAGSSSGKLLSDRAKRGLLQKMEIVEVPDHDDALELVEQSKADAYVTTDNLLFARRAMSKEPKHFAVVGSHLVVEPIALMMRKDDPEFKKLVDRELTNLMLNGTAGALYKKWFLSPVPPNGINLEMPLHHLLRDQFLWPTDR